MHTHRLTVNGRVVRKRFTSWDNGEPEREWAALVALARHAPGLAPTPIGKEREDGAPVIVMSRLPGEPLGATPVTTAQRHAVASALRRLFAAPVDPNLPERAAGPSVMRSLIRRWAAESYALQDCVDPVLVGSALDAARQWLALDFADQDRVVHPVLAVADGNLDNMLWDGTSLRFVDFEEFGVSDLAYEVADVIEHASSRLRRLLDVDALICDLSLTAEQQARLSAFRQLFATYWLMMLLPGNRGFTHNPPGSTEDQARHVLTLLNG